MIEMDVSYRNFHLPRTHSIAGVEEIGEAESGAAVVVSECTGGGRNSAEFVR